METVDLMSQLNGNVLNNVTYNGEHVDCCHLYDVGIAVLRAMDRED